MTKNVKGKHAMPPTPASTPSPPSEASGFAPAGMAPLSVGPNDEERARKRRKGLKIFGITIASLVGVVFAAYVAGAVVFMGRFFPNTVIADVDVSMKTPDEVGDILDEAVHGYTFRVVGQGVDLRLSADEVGMSLDAEAITEDVLSSMNPWAWPLEVFEEHDITDVLASSYASTGLSEVVGAEVAKINETATPPTDATIAYNEATDRFEVVDQVYGTALDADKVVEEVAAGAMKLSPQIMLSEDVLLLPAVTSDDERLAEAAEEANGMLVADLDLLIAGEIAASVDADSVSSWITLTPELTVSFDNEAMVAWARSVVDGYSTIGAERTYTRSDGKTVTVSGGSYGWSFDAEALVQIVSDAVSQGSTGSVDVPVKNSAQCKPAAGNVDWGARYCDVDLSEQYARFYDDAGACVWETPVITGKPNADMATPEGVYYVTRKASPETLNTYEKGEKEPKKTKVEYWMPFVGNVIGLHDAWWQPRFGGTMYRDGYGSHGCVNLPSDKAAELYDTIQVNDVVVVHW